jgi:hypothetical protein
MSCAILSPKSSTSLKALVDINLFEDVFRKRTGWRASEAVILAVRRGKVIGYISALTVPILYFFRSHSHSETEARRLTKTITRKFRVVALTNSILKDAIEFSLVFLLIKLFFLKEKFDLIRRCLTSRMRFNSTPRNQSNLTTWLLEMSLIFRYQM